MSVQQDQHRYYLQRFVAEKFMGELQAKQLHRKACNTYGVVANDANFDGFIETINDNLRPLFLEIRKGRSEDDGKNYFAFVNCSEDENSKLATSFSPNDIAFFKKALEMIVTSEDGYVSSMDMINIGSELEKKLTVTASEALIAKLVEDKWLTEESGDCSLGPRTMIELSMYLKRIYQDAIMDCKLCSHMVVKGQSCGACGIRVHTHCISTYFKAKGREANARKCPGCLVPWVHEVPNVPDTVPVNGMTNGDIPSSSSQSQPGPSKRARQKR